MSFERQNHLVYGRRGDLEVLLHFGLRRWGPVDFSVVVNERQVLALLIGIGSLHGRADYLTISAGRPKPWVLDRVGAVIAG